MSETSKFNKTSLPGSQDELGSFMSRLEKAIGDQSVRSFARATGLSDTVLRQYLAGKSEPTRPALIAIAKAANIHVGWLAAGEGPMQKGGMDGVVEPEANDVKVPAAHPSAQLNAEEFVLVPRYDVQTSCGGGALVESEQVVDHLAFKRRWIDSLGLQSNCLALISAKGDSMEPTIKDGFLLLVDLRQREIKADAIYVIRNGHELVAKRCQKLFSGDLKIKSDNPAYDEQLVPADRIGILDIIGRVVWGGGKM